MRKNDTINPKSFLQNFKNTLKVSVVLLFLPIIAHGQTTVFIDAFQTALHANYSITKLDDGTSKVQMNSSSAPTHLQIYNDNGSVDNSGTNKRAYITRSLTDFSSPYMKKLNENETVTWTFNMRNSRGSTTTPHVNGELGLGDNNYAQLVVLVSSNADFLNASANGYAVSLIRDGLGSTIFKLVRFEGGLSATGNLTTLVESTTTSAPIASTNWVSVKVVYASATNTWSLHLRDDLSNANAGSDKDPMDETLAYTSIGSVVNDTYTSTEMTSCGFFANTGIQRGGNNAKALYDNFGVRATAVSTGYTSSISRDYQIRSIQNGFAFLDTEHAKVDVYNSIGILQQSAEVKGNHQFVMKNAGMYILRISTAKGETTTKYLVR